MGCNDRTIIAFSATWHHSPNAQPGRENNRTPSQEFSGLASCQSLMMGLLCSSSTKKKASLSLIPGPRCYSGPSIAPDSISSRARSARLGILLLDPTHNLKCYIKAKIDHVSSVLMAESASMALAAKICALLSISDISFLTDSQILASFFNGPDLDKPPQWEIKPYTQKFLNATGNYNWKVFKVQRDFNVTAHVLANQAFRSTLGTEIIEQYSCTNASHIDSCPLREALNSVSWESYSLIAVACC